MGRPRKIEASSEFRLNIRADGALREKLNRLIRAEPGDPPSQADMVRRLIDRAVERLERRKSA